MPRYLSAYTEREKLRHTVRPGISGWAQVNGRNFVSWEDKLEYDVYYVEHLSLFMDLKVLIKTLQNMLAGSKDISVIPQMPYLDEYRAGLNEKNKEE